MTLAKQLVAAAVAREARREATPFRFEDVMADIPTPEEQAGLYISIDGIVAAPVKYLASLAERTELSDYDRRVAALLVAAWQELMRRP